MKLLAGASRYLVYLLARRLLKIWLEVITFFFFLFYCDGVTSKLLMCFTSMAGWTIYFDFMLYVKFLLYRKMNLTMAVVICS